MTFVINEHCWPQGRPSTWRDHCWHKADAYECYSDGYFCCRCPGGLISEEIQIPEKTHGSAVLIGRPRPGMAADKEAVSLTRKYAMEKHFPWACQNGCGRVAESQQSWWCEKSPPCLSERDYVAVLPPSKEN